MVKFYKAILACLMVLGLGSSLMAQDKYWSAQPTSTPVSNTDKAVARLTFPKEFKLFELNLATLREDLFTVVSPSPSRRSTVISVPNAEGRLEQFEVFEASNFEPDLQAMFPEIRAFSGRGITDRYATLKLSISPGGIQTMVFRTEKENEFMEPYSADHRTYAVYKSTREKGSLPWTCSTDEKNIYNDINKNLPSLPAANNGVLKTMRLVQSCNGEYANWFGAFSSAQVSLVLAAYNNTLTRCNGCYEKDLATHLNLIAATTNVIFYDPATDPYTTLSAWNLQLQQTLTSIIGNANYDIGHMFGQSGGGGNAGCIGCVCVDPANNSSLGKGAGITSPADGIPQGDNFDIDYVVHEVGHQLGGNHTFSHNNEGSGRQKEVGAGITIMGYAGITPYDPAPHSIDIFHETSIEQIQANLVNKTCPISTSLAGINATPVINPLTSYTIPISTPFYLSGTATDADGDPLTYCWEQNDNHGGQNGANSVAYAAKPVGPNFISFSPSPNNTRLFPRLSTILNGLLITPTLGGDAICNVEALSNVSRTLNFRLTVRDNRPYNGTATGQTEFADMAVNVTNTAGPFQVTSPNTAVTWPTGSSQTITWAVNGTNTGSVNCANVRISLSTDGGNTFPTVILASTANDGTETITVPSVPATTTARIKIEAIGNIFFDINDVNFSIIQQTGFTFNTAPATVTTCPAGPTMVVNLGTTAYNGFNTPINLTATGNPAGTTVSISPNPLTPGGTAAVTLNNTNTLAFGTYVINISGVAGSEVGSTTLTYIINAGAAPVITQQPATQTVCQNTSASFVVAVTGALSYQWQRSTDGGATWSNIGGAIASTYTIPSAQLANIGLYRCVINGQCGVATSNNAQLNVNAAPSISSQPTGTTLCAGANASFSVSATGAGLSYQWELSTNGCSGPWASIPSATSQTYTVNGITAGQNNYGYRCVVSGSCAPAATSNCALLNVVTAVTVSTQPVDQVACEGANASYVVAGSGAGILYQWQISTDGGATWNNIGGANSATYVATAVTAGMNGNRYRCLLSNATCTTPGISNAGLLTVNRLPAISSNPSDVTICVGASNTFSVAASGTGIGYQWQLSTDGGANYSNISGATSSSYTAAAVTIGMNGNRYRAVVNGVCAPNANSAPALLTVIAPVVVSAQPANKEICSGQNTSFSVTGSSVQTINYQWQVSADNGNTWNNIPNGTANGVTVSGATTATISISNALTAISGTRYRALLSSATCAAPTVSSGGLLTVRALPTVTLAASKLDLLPGQQSTLTAIPSASTGGTVSISWLYNSNPLAVTGTSYVANIEKVGAYQVNVQELWTSGLACTNQSAVVTLSATVSDKLFIFPTPNDGRFTVSYYNNGGTSTNRRIVIFATSGQKVYDRIFPVTGSYTLLNIDLRYISPGRGIYYVMVGDANGNKLVDGKVHVR